ncbi:c-type cytochrome [Hymenobacter persicinus]|uniref:Cytochrome c n=1 Tax=Hymenobacter persicinus TaxID=2025506 RepID=A0A4Q5LAN2_9BACT|nr:cytochrome c [Hymenobacter persicinus]RYU78021.1 cytochrome c [Hymenobacter persicinus]
MTHSLKLGLQASAILFGSVVATSCNQADNPGIEYAPQMYESIPYDPLRQVSTNTINPMGTNERTPVVGTVARGKEDYYSHIPKDSVTTAERKLRNPLAHSKANLEEGKTLYTRNCLHCHGEAGDGQGLVGVKFKGVPNYSTGAYKTMNEGHIYHVIQWGRNRMMPHGSQVNPEERWKIAMYVKVLQLGKGADGMADYLKAYGGNASMSGDSTQAKDPMTQKPTGQAGAEKGSENPGQGDKGRNGSAN